MRGVPREDIREGLGVELDCEGVFTIEVDPIVSMPLAVYSLFGFQSNDCSYLYRLVEWVKLGPCVSLGQDAPKWRAV